MAGQRFQQICLAALQDWKAARRRVLNRTSHRDAVHDWRIATRRLLALEALLAPTGATPKPRSIAHLTHEAFRASGRLRDAQLCGQQLMKLSRAMPQAARVAQHEGRQASHLARHLHRALRRIHPDRLAHVVGEWLQPQRGDPDDVLTERAGRRLQAQSRRLASDNATTTSHGPHRLHRRRLHLKQARYMAELARAAGCPLPQQLRPSHLAALQSRLGAVTDLDVQLRAVARFVADHPRWRAQGRTLRHALHQRRESVLLRISRGNVSGA